MFTFTQGDENMKDFVYEKIRTTAIFLAGKTVIEKQPLNDFDIIETGYKKDQRPLNPIVTGVKSTTPNRFSE